MKVSEDELIKRLRLSHENLSNLDVDNFDFIRYEKELDKLNRLCIDLIKAKYLRKRKEILKID